MPVQLNTPGRELSKPITPGFFEKGFTAFLLEKQLKVLFQLAESI